MVTDDEQDLRHCSSFDGHVDESVDPKSTTHILTLGDCQDKLALQDACPRARIVNMEWLDACVTQEKRLETDKYEL